MRRLLIQFATALALVIAPVAAFASPLVSPAWLSENLDDAKLVIIDLRNKIDEGSYETFLEGHIPGAIHSDYLKDGWRVGRDGVVGLLPEADQFESLARRLGVSDDTHVVLVPAGVSSTDFGSAARAYCWRGWLPGRHRRWGSRRGVATFQGTEAPRCDARRARKQVEGSDGAMRAGPRC